jgi:hypothetical protein
MDLQGIEPWTAHMLSENYTTKPQARINEFFTMNESWLKNSI